MNVILKTIIFLVLFATLVALYFFKVPDCEPLKALIGVGLSGMGYAHMGPMFTNNSAIQAAKDAGYARLRFLVLLIGAGVTALAMTACATPTATPQQMQIAYVQACVTYNAGFGTAVALKQAGKLNPSQIEQISLIDATITPLCTGPLPANPQTATAQITAAVTSLAILETINKE